VTGVRAVGWLQWAAIATGLVLAGCGGAAAPTAQLSHAASRRDPANRSAPNATAQPNSAQRCTQVYCVPQTVPAPAPPTGTTPKAAAMPPNNAQRCTQVYCVPQPVPRVLATFPTRD
jgi:hypothetical protein